MKGNVLRRPVSVARDSRPLQGAACVVLGPGPLPAGVDLWRLRSQDCIGLDDGFRVWDGAGWYPWRHVCTDPVLIQACHAGIERLAACGLVQDFLVHPAFFDLYPHRRTDPRFLASPVARPSALAALDWAAGLGAARVVLAGLADPALAPLLDRAAQDLPCRVDSLGPQEALTAGGILGQADPDRVLGLSPLGCVFIPCTAGDIDDILGNFRLWATAACLPCDGPVAEPAPVLAVVFNNATAAARAPEIAAAFAEAGMARFFDGVQFECLDLEGARDVYIRDHSLPVGDLGYKAGPNTQVFEALRRVARFGRYAFLMEADCLPIRRGWLSRLQAIVAGAEPFWVMGSPYRGEVRLARDYIRHINGNAVYAAGDPGFQTFAADVWEPQTWHLVRVRDKRLAYDCILEILFSDTNLETDADSLALWKRSAHRFRYSDYIQNIAARRDLARPDPDLPDRLRRDSPDTHILHCRPAQQAALAALDPRLPLPGEGAGFPRLALIGPGLPAPWPEAALVRLAPQDAGAAARTGAEMLVWHLPAGVQPAASDLAMARACDLPLVLWLEGPPPDDAATLLADMLHLAARRLVASADLAQCWSQRFGLPFVPADARPDGRNRLRLLLRDLPAPVHGPGLPLWLAAELLRDPGSAARRLTEDPGLSGALEQALRADPGGDRLRHHLDRVLRHLGGAPDRTTQEERP
ncbi:hypothetical protein SAMN05421774_11141 [Gemmobacter megaterium]|uniref:Uncharacterized protein n=1 Tax=Gemmobacter megaterium TaxID=1086013 RepID=A0A1N7QI91_9RHOB|nr:hypothetical protein SAMN05421774_11141 [Gemmobacter megaterium]